MSKIRSFLAIELPSAIAKGIERVQYSLKQSHADVRWVEPSRIHLTLKFLGHIPFKQVTEITKAVEEAMRGILPFHLEVSGLGAFPNLKQPRVIWIGIGGETDKLSSLQQNIDSALVPFGFAKEEHPFVPHLTLARIRQTASPRERRTFGDLVTSISFESKYDIAVDAISMMISRLTPALSIYTRLAILYLWAKKN